MQTQNLHMTKILMQSYTHIRATVTVHVDTNIIVYGACKSIELPVNAETDRTEYDTRY